MAIMNINNNNDKEIDKPANEEVIKELLNKQGQVITNENEALAKTIVFSNTTKYYVRTNNISGKPFNKLVDDINKVDSYSKLSVWKFAPVTKAIFDMYKLYLQENSDYAYKQTVMGLR